MSHGAINTWAVEVRWRPVRPPGTLGSMDPSLWRTAIISTTADMAVIPVDRLASAVPSCPGWDIERLMRHLARVQGWVTGVLDTEPDGVAPVAPRPEADELVGAFLARMGTEVVAHLDRIDPSQPVPGFVGAVPARFWWRRMAHEATVHRWDAQEALAPGTVPTVDPRLAVDGIDEAFEVILPLRFDVAGFGATGESLHLHATDTAGEWTIRFPAGSRPAVESGHAKGDAAVRGPAGDLLLAVWGRLGPDRLDVLGDADVLRRYQAATRY